MFSCLFTFIQNDSSLFTFFEKKNTQLFLYNFEKLVVYTCYDHQSMKNGKNVNSKVAVCVQFRSTCVTWTWGTCLIERFGLLVL